MAEAWFTAVAANDLGYVLKHIRAMKGERNSDGTTALMIATRLNYMQLVILLAQHEKGFLDNNGTSALLEAVKRANLSFVRILGKLEYDLLLGRDKTHTALDAALAMPTVDKSVVLELLSAQGCQFDALKRSGLQVTLESPYSELAVPALRQIKYSSEQLNSALVYSTDRRLDAKIITAINRAIRDMSESANTFTSDALDDLGMLTKYKMPISGHQDVSRSMSAEVARSSRSSSRFRIYQRQEQQPGEGGPVLTIPLIRNPPAVSMQASLTASKANLRISELENQVADLKQKLDVSRKAYSKQTAQLLEVTRSRKEESTLKANQARKILDLERELRVSRSATPLFKEGEEMQSAATNSMVSPSTMTVGVQTGHSTKYIDTSTSTDGNCLSFACVVSIDIPPQQHPTQQSPPGLDYSTVKTTSFYESRSPTPTAVDAVGQYEDPMSMPIPRNNSWSYVRVTTDPNNESDEYMFEQTNIDRSKPLSPLIHPTLTKLLNRPGMDFESLGGRNLQTPLQMYDDTERNPLIEAVLNRDLDKVKLLAQLHGLNDCTGKTALMYAAEIGFHEAIPILAPKEAGMMRPNARYIRPGTALMHAAMSGHTKCVEMLIGYEGEVKAQTKYNWTALMFATVQDYIDIVRILAPLESRMVTTSDCIPDLSCNGVTALLLAVRLNHLDVARVLAPYEIDIKDARNLSADLLARDSSFRSYLRNLGNHDVQ